MSLLHSVTMPTGVVDARMPRMSGLDLLERLKTESDRPPRHIAPPP